MIISLFSQTTQRQLTAGTLRSAQHYNKEKHIGPFYESHTAVSSGYFGKLTQPDDTRIERDRLLTKAIEQTVMCLLVSFSNTSLKNSTEPALKSTSETSNKTINLITSYVNVKPKQ